MTHRAFSILFQKKVRFVCTKLAVLILFLLSPFFTKSILHAAVVINELYPKTEPSTNNWVELYNTGSEQVSLDRWKLQNSEGEVKTFIPNASAVIAPHGFLTFPGSQTNISFAISGDIVRLFDEKNNQVDSQSYPSILGYNTSMGRSSDGGGLWVICTTATYNKPNNCPEPSPTPTPIVSVPTSLPTNTSTPIPTRLPTKTHAPTSIPSPDQQTFGSFLPSPTQTNVLKFAGVTSLTPTPDLTSLTLKMDKILATKILLVAMVSVVVGGIAVMIFLLRKKKHNLPV